MKKIILTVIVALSIISGKVFAAGEENVSKQTKETFKREFPSAEFVKWEEMGESGVFLARFVYDSQAFVAYFNEYGTMLASARLVTISNLPYKVRETIRKRYADQEIIKIEELTMDGTLSYFFSVDDEKGKALLRVFYDGTIHRIKEDR